MDGGLRMDYKVKNVKTFMGTEGHGFNASLYRDGKKVAFIIDSAQGGCYDFQWTDWKEPKVNIINHKGKPYTFLGTPEEKILYKLVEKLPKTKSEIFPDGMKETIDGFVAKIIDDFELKQKLKRACKKSYLFQIGKEIGGNEYRTIKKTSQLTKETLISFIKKEYPNQKYKILEA